MRFEALLALVPLAIAAPVLTPREGTVVPNRYIVKFKDAEISTAVDLAISLLPKAPRHVYSFGKFKGFAAEFDESVLKTIKALPSVSSLQQLLSSNLIEFQVEYIEKDAVIKAWDDETLLERAKSSLEKRAYVTQSSSTWGLGRVSHVNRGTSSYTYDDSAGAGTCSYVIDTGIYVAHPEFEGRKSRVGSDMVCASAYLNYRRHLPRQLRR
jgi:hypothetical protein